MPHEIPHVAMVDVRLLKSFLHATTQLNWWRDLQPPQLDDLSEQFCAQFPAHGCLLQWLLECAHQPEASLGLTRSSVQLLEKCHKHGISLRLAWPRSWSATIDAWIGPRFYLTHAANFSPTARYASIVCSQIGRHGCKLPNWPALLDAALQHCYRHHERLLVVPETTLSEPLKQFLAHAPLQSLKVRLDKHTTGEDWLIHWLRRLTVDDEALADASIDFHDQVHVSPPIAESVASFAERPLQDRIACAIADRMMVLNIRERGTIARLLHARLNDPSFPLASNFVAITTGRHNAPLPIEYWLDQGAVGWVLPECEKTDFVPAIAHCRVSTAAPSAHDKNIFTQSLTWRMRADTIYSAESALRPLFLVHCTRGNSGPLPDESIESYLDRAWNTGHVPEAHPLTTLQQIIQDRRIVGNTRLTRTSHACVSFSAVPLPELLARRRFRSHLGRWDWEPFGLLIRRAALESLGAKPVIYGTDEDYKKLNRSEQPYFQPLGKKDKRTTLDWSSEQEWRLLGNLNLADLPHEAVTLFVATQQQAQQLARYSPWSVAWIQDCV